VLHPVTCLKTCHFAACFTLLSTSISIYYVKTAACFFSPSCRSSFLSWVHESLSTFDPRLLTTKLICSNSHSGAATLSAPMMLSISVLLICFCFFYLRNPSFLSVDHLNSKIYTICRSSLIATPSGRLPQKRFAQKNPGSRLYRAS